MHLGGNHRWVPPANKLIANLNITDTKYLKCRVAILKYLEVRHKAMNKMRQVFQD